MIPRKPTLAMIEAARQSVSGYPRAATIEAIWQAMWDSARSLSSAERCSNGHMVNPERIWLIHDGGSDEAITWADNPNPYAEYGEQPDAAVEYVRADVMAAQIARMIDAASADTRPKGGDGTKIAAPSVTSGAVPEGQTPNPSPSPAAGR